MRRFGVALAAIGLLAAPPLSVQAAADARATVGQDSADSDNNASRSRRRGKPAATPAGGDPARGMADAPALIQAASLRCTLTEANFLGQTKPTDGVMQGIYEVACSDGPGYLLFANAETKAFINGFECLQLRDGNAAAAAEGKDNKNALACKLAGNADPVQGVGRVAAPLIAGCTIDAARYIGSSASTKENNYEVGCNGRPGAVIKLPMPGATTQASAIGCEKFGEDSNVRCELTTAEEKLAPVKALAQASGKACQVTNGRYVGASGTTQEEFFEAKCADGSGFMVVADAAGAFKRSIDCARATNVAGGCTLTDAIESQNAEAATYKGLATSAGFNCDVDQYRLLGMETATKREVVELHCKNTPEGLIAFFPAGAGKTEFHDCTKVGYRKLSCSLTKPEQSFARLGRDVAGKGKTCQVTGFRGVGTAQAGKTEFVEVSCATGPGLMVEYTTGAAPFTPATGVFTCAEAVNIGGGCKLGAAAGRS